MRYAINSLVVLCMHRNISDIEQVFCLGVGLCMLHRCSEGRAETLCYEKGICKQCNDVQFER